MGEVSAGGVLSLSIESTDMVFEIIEGIDDPNVRPPEFAFTRDDAASLFERPRAHPFGSACGVFGVRAPGSGLAGIVALQPFALDGRPCLELMIFFRSGIRGSISPLEATKDVIAFASKVAAGAPIITLVYHKNKRGKRFYERAGFKYESLVNCDGFDLELWEYRRTEG